LKSADAATDAIRLGREEALLGGLAVSGPGVAQPQPSTPARGLGSAGQYQPQMRAEARKQSVEMNEQSRYVRGRAFYRNGSQWVDSEVQKFSSVNPVRVQFDSPEYFDLLKQHPEAVAWLSVGRNLQLALGRTVYEIYE